MLKSIYNEKENLISNGLENKIFLLKSGKCKTLDTKSINPHLVFNKLPLSNNNFIINI